MHTVVVGLGFGDEAKGATVDWLCETQPIDYVIRTGAAQAAHNVVRPDGRHHTFAQFGSGMFHQRVKTHLSRYMVVDPLRMHSEALGLESVGVEDPMGRTTIDEDCLIVTPYHAAVNRLRERQRGPDRHGSCGIGIGETRAYALTYFDSALRAGDLLCGKSLIAAKLATIRGELIREFPDDDSEIWEPDFISELLVSYRQFSRDVDIVGPRFTTDILRDGACVFESSQGVLLDEWRGFHPYTTWSTTTFEPADALLAEAGQDAYHLGVLRTYMTRHGAGPMPSEDPELLPLAPEAHNDTGEFQGAWRVGHFDSVLYQYALEVAGHIDGLALSHLDVTQDDPRFKVAIAHADTDRMVYRLPVNEDKTDLVTQEETTKMLGRAEAMLLDVHGHWADIVEEELDLPVTVIADGPTSEHRSILP